MAAKLNKDVWVKICTQPRETIKRIVSANVKYGFIALSGIYGFNMLMHIAQTLSVGQDFSLTGIIIGAIILSIFLGMFAISVTAGLVYWTGQWIGGKGSYLPIRAAVAWSNVPNIVNIILWFLLMGYFGSSLFTANFSQMQFSGGELAFTSIVFALQTIFSVWSLVLLVKTIGQVQGFSAWKGLLNILIPFFMIGAAVWIISYLVWFIRGMPS